MLQTSLITTDKYKTALSNSESRQMYFIFGLATLVLRYIWVLFNLLIFLFCWQIIVFILGNTPHFITCFLVFKSHIFAVKTVKSSQGLQQSWTALHQKHLMRQTRCMFCQHTSSQGVGPVTLMSPVSSSDICGKDCVWVALASILVTARKHPSVQSSQVEPKQL